MRTYFKIISVSLLFVISVSCALRKNISGSDTTIFPLEKNMVVNEGSLVYALPLSVLHIAVSVEHEYEKPGPYSKYAGAFLGLDDIISEENETWTIKNIDIITYEELDPSEFYVIESNSLIQSNALLLKKEGLILDINPSLYNKIPKSSGSDNIDFPGFRFSDMGSYEYFNIDQDTTYRVVEIDTAFIRIPYMVEKRKPLTAEQLAENAARTLLDIREGKQMILTGEANVFPQDASSINEMNSMEKEYLALFAGKTYRETKTYFYDFIPDKSIVENPVVLFKFSEMTGIIDPSKPGGNIVNIEFVPALRTKDVVFVTKPDQDNNFDRLYYRIPDIVNIRISDNKDLNFNYRKLIYQFGEVITLPANYILGN